MKYVLALDQGTTSSRAILFDRNGRVRAMAQRELAQIFPQPGWVEHDPEEIWRSQLACARRALRIGEPRTLSDTDRLTLEDLAGWAEREINLSIEHSRIRAQLVSVLDRIAEGALLFGTDGRIQWANEQLSALLGHTAPDLAGKEIDSVVARESLGPVRKAIESLRPETEKGTTTLKAQMRHKDGRTLPLQLALVVSVVDGERLVTAVISRP